MRPTTETEAIHQAALNVLQGRAQARRTIHAEQQAEPYPQATIRLTALKTGQVLAEYEQAGRELGLCIGSWATALRWLNPKDTTRILVQAER